MRNITPEEHTLELCPMHGVIVLLLFQMYSELFQSQQKHQVALEILTYHCCASNVEVEQLSVESQNVTLPKDFYR